METISDSAPATPSVVAAVPAPGPSPAPTPAVPAPAPSAAAPAEVLPMTAAEVAAFASRSLAGAPETPPTPTPTPAQVESPSAAVAPPPAPVQPSGPPAADDDAEPSAEVLATLSDPGKRALQAEREKRKEAKSQLTAATAEIERLKALIPAPAEPAPAAPAPTPAPRAPVVPTLAACKTSAEVDAVVRQAITDGALAMELNTVLNTVGLEAVVERFQQSNVTEFRGIPLEQLTPQILARELRQTQEAAEEVKLSAPQQRQVLVEVRQHMAQAVNLLPGLKDPNSAVRKEFARLASNPAITALGPEWPVLVARNILGAEAAARLQQPAAPVAAAPLPPVPTPVAQQAPAAPRTSVTPAAPAPTDEVATRLANGTATAADMAKLASSSLRQGLPLGAR